ncbi:MAG: hydroxymethylbilane synthase [Thermodesulfobacteriota bacterium]
MSLNELRIGTRGSPLALFQAHWVRNQLLKAYPNLRVRLIKIKTTGDKIRNAPLAKIGGKGLFVKEIEEALLRKEIDLAVHSIKDVPTDLPEGLHLSAITKREDPRDVFISREGRLLRDLPKGARIGTSSLRRQVQLSSFREDFMFIPLRGNIETRLKKLERLHLDGIVLAYAGVKRLGFENRITEILPIEVLLPAIGQGALGIETRIGDKDYEEKIRVLEDQESSIAIRAERAFLKRLGGGCQVPIAAFCRIEDSTLKLDAIVGTLDGKRLIRDRMEGSPDRPEDVGERLAENLLYKGAEEILREVYQRATP